MNQDLTRRPLDAPYIVRTVTGMTKSNQLTAETITSKQIRALRDEAAQHDDPITVDMCAIALDGEDSDGTCTTLGTPCTVAQARANLADAINSGQG